LRYYEDEVIEKILVDDIGYDKQTYTEKEV
jgi:hypothetical protein